MTHDIFGSAALYLQVCFVAGFARYLQMLRTARSCPVLLGDLPGWTSVIHFVSEIR